MGKTWDALEPVALVEAAVHQPLPLGPAGVLHGKLPNGMT